MRRGETSGKVRFGSVGLVAAIVFCLAAMVLMTAAFSLSPALAANASVTKAEQTDTCLSYSGSWATFSTASASGGSYRRANTSGASVTITFKGTTLTWIATKGVTMGKADVSVDGKPPVSVNLAATKVSYQQKVFSTGDLAAGYHTVKISWNQANIVGKYVNVDAVEVVGSLASTTRVEQTSSSLAWTGSWTTVSSSSYSGGNFRHTNTSGSSVKVNFTGVRVSVIAKKAANYGIARIRLDGGSPVTVDLYNSTTVYKRTVWSSAFLLPGNHTLTIEWTGTKRSAATNTNVSLDAVDVVASVLGTATTPTSTTSTTVPTMTPITLAPTTATTTAPSTTTTTTASTTTTTVVALLATTTTTMAPTTTTTAPPTTTTMASTTTTTVAPTTTTTAPTTTTVAPTTTTTAPPTTTTMASTTTTTVAPTTTTTAPATTTTTTQSVIYNVRNYGARADGVTDDVAAVQAAVNACYAAGGGIVYMPAGTYTFYLEQTFYPGNGGNVILKDRVRIRGDGVGQTIVKGTHQDDSLFVAASASYIGVSHLSAYHTQAGYADAFKFMKCTGVNINHVEAYNFYDGIHFVGCTDSIGSNVIVHDMACNGLEIGEAGSELTQGTGDSFVDCEAYNCTNSAFRIRGVVPGEQYSSRTDHASLIRCYGHDSGEAFASTYASNLTFVDCTAARTIWDQGFLMYLANVVGAHLTNCPTAYLVTSANSAADWALYGSQDCTGIVTQ